MTYTSRTTASTNTPHPIQRHLFQIGDICCNNINIILIPCNRIFTRSIAEIDSEIEKRRRRRKNYEIRHVLKLLSRISISSLLKNRQCYSGRRENGESAVSERKLVNAKDAIKEEGRSVNSQIGEGRGRSLAALRLRDVLNHWGLNFLIN
ncbi:unnamed protein product [Vicia faba]|uniref:Uncharacterized protein n=1 Tax=Vicia faba TaxID=3906 RepID=A0AAV1AJS5_VICFA|nr:unnamed protein product [Vicia faba]